MLKRRHDPQVLGSFWRRLGGTRTVELHQKARVPFRDTCDARHVVPEHSCHTLRRFFDSLSGVAHAVETSAEAGLQGTQCFVVWRVQQAAIESTTVTGVLFGNHEGLRSYVKVRRLGQQPSQLFERRSTFNNGELHFHVRTQQVAAVKTGGNAFRPGRQPSAQQETRYVAIWLALGPHPVGFPRFAKLGTGR